MVAALRRASTLMDPSSDVLLVRGPIAHACSRAHWPAECGVDVDYGNALLRLLSDHLKTAVGRLSAERRVAGGVTLG
jgi:hypothetical protein